jgi:hypothetical protein
MTESRPERPEATPGEECFVVAVRQELDRSCAALDGPTLSSLKSIRHCVLERKQSRHSRVLLPFGGLVTACLLVASVLLLNPLGLPTQQRQGSEPPLEDIELLTDTEGLDFYEDYEFYQWLAESGSSI